MLDKRFKFPRNAISAHDPDKVVIVSIIGRSSLINKNDKLQSLGFVFNRSQTNEPNQSENITIEGFYDTLKHVIYLHAETLYDSHNLIKFCERTSTDHMCNGLDNTLENPSFDVTDALNATRSSFARAFFFLLHVSHVIVLNHPGANFDLSYLPIFKTLHSCRQKFGGEIEQILSESEGIGKDWLVHRRLCTPRLLVRFETCPAGIRRSSNVYESIKKLEHAIEDKLYSVFRRIKVVSTSSNALFSIPLNQEFVYINHERQTDPNTFALQMLIDSCQTNFIDDEPQFTYPTSDNDYLTLENESLDKHTFLNFLNGHIQCAITKGFDESCVATKRYFEMPDVNVWMQASNRLYSALIDCRSTQKAAHVREEFADELTSLNVDTRFSEQRCIKVLPLAFARYVENLPPHYTVAYHETRLNIAMAVFHNHARGPAFDKYSGQLMDDCRKYFENGRQLCEYLSLTGNPCILPKKSTDHEHSSGVRYISSCDCGGVQGTRDDPFTLKVANYLFYQSLSRDCNCHRLDRIDFPVFQPSTKEFKAADVRSAGKLMSKLHVDVAKTEYTASDCETSDMIDTTKSYNVPTTHTMENSMSGEYTPDDHPTDKSEKNVMTRQPSTTEYLPGMLTQTSPLGLLPQFPSWSLVCLGPSSLYSHNVGLTESQHPGFLSGSNFLLPWDETITTQTKAIIDSRKFASSSKGSQRKKMFQAQLVANATTECQEVVVKVFVGVEYECPRGHRFMMSASDKVLRASGGIVKESGHKVVKSDMPLYFNCPCRSSSNKSPLVAKLMRLHIVTPKNLAYVTLNPRVQLDATSPIYIPQFDLPIQLTQSTYWVLRLPYVYVNDNEPYTVPFNATPPTVARLMHDTWKVVSSS